MKKNYRLGIDIGGTFTDFAVVEQDTGAVQVEKMLTSAKAPEKTVLKGVDRLGDSVSDMLTQTSEVIHATTLITNVILERKGAKTALLTTSGFRDILELAREVRYDIFDMFIGTSAGAFNAACFAYGGFTADKIKRYWSKLI